MCPEIPCRIGRSPMWWPGWPRNVRQTRVSHTSFRTTAISRSLTMSNESTISRRGLFMKLGILFNGLVATALAVPIVRFLLSSVTRGRADAYLSWVSLGRVDQFPEGETRLATFRNPYVMPTDGKTADT